MGSRKYDDGAVKYALSTVKYQNFFWITSVGVNIDLSNERL